jgi:phage terminase small subunit
MNVKQFKKLIKEAVIEAMYEELPDMISEVMKQQNKQSLTENRTMNFTSANVPTGKLPADVRSSLMAQLGSEFGFQQPARTDLKVIDAVDQTTGEKVNPYLAFIEDAAANMTPMDRVGLRQLE